MIIIGEKINGNDPRVAQAIKDRDDALIAELAEQQAEAGVDYILVNSGELEQEEARQATAWLMETVEDTVDTPLYLESTDPWILVDATELSEEPGFFGYFSTEANKPAVLVPLFAMKKEWCAVAYCRGNEGVPEEVKDKVAFTRNLVERAIAVGAKSEKLFVDPLIVAATAEEAAAQYAQIIEQVHALYPKVKFIAAETARTFRAAAAPEECEKLAAALEAAGVEAIIA